MTSGNYYCLKAISGIVSKISHDHFIPTSLTFQHHNYSVISNADTALLSRLQKQEFE